MEVGNRGVGNWMKGVKRYTFLIYNKINKTRNVTFNMKITVIYKSC